MFQRLYFAQQKQEGITLEEQKEKVIDLIDEITSMVERMQIDVEHFPLRLLGMKANYELMSEIYTTLAGLVLAVGQKVLTGESSA